MEQAQQHAAASAQYLGFRVGGEEYATDILRVQEIKCWDGVTRVPHTPPYLLGVINLRGSIVPVIDLRLRLVRGPAAFEPTTAVVVVQVSGARGRRTVGLVVDAVTRVHDIEPGMIGPSPTLADGGGSGFIEGIADVDRHLVIILDTQRLVTESVESDADA